MRGISLNKDQCHLHLKRLPTLALVKAGGATFNLTRLVEFKFSENLDSIFWQRSDFRPYKWITTS